MQDFRYHSSLEYVPGIGRVTAPVFSLLWPRENLERTQQDFSHPCQSWCLSLERRFIVLRGASSHRSDALTSANNILHFERNWVLFCLAPGYKTGSFLAILNTLGTWAWSATLKGSYQLTVGRSTLNPKLQSATETLIAQTAVLALRDI